MQQSKDESLSKQSRRAMAELLSHGKVESARIRTENIIRSDLLTELHEILELYCELLLARSGLLENTSAVNASGKPLTGKDAVVPLEELDSGIYEAVVVIVHAAPRTEIRELQTVRQVLVERYGRQFAEEATRDEKGVVPERVKRKLRVEPPGRELVESYLSAIAAAYDVPYGEKSQEEEEDVQKLDEEVQAEEGNDRGGRQDDGDDDDVGGGTVKESIEEVGAPGGTKGHAKKEDAEEKAANKAVDETRNSAALKESTPSPPRHSAGAKSPVSIAPPSPRTDNANPRVRVPGAPPELKPNDKMKKANAAPAAKKPEEKKEEKGGPGGQVPDVDDLEARFKLLKR